MTVPCDRLGYGKDDQVTFAGNYIHHTSGRSPKLEFNSYWHAYNNYWHNNTGHAFDVGKGTKALIEGNVFSEVNTPFETDSSPGETFAVTSSDKSTCDSSLGRTCAVNSLESSGGLSASDESVLSSWPSGESDITVLDASKVRASVLANAGVGKLGGGSGASNAVTASAPTQTPSVVARHFRGAAPWIPAFLYAGPGSAHTGASPRTWRTVGVKPTQPPLPEVPLSNDKPPFAGGFPFGLGV